MINVKSEIYKGLKAVTDNVTDDYPSDWESFPVVVYLEDQNTVHEITDNEEQSSEIKYTVHIWHDRSTSELAIKVDEVFRRFGFRRTLSQDLADNQQLRHKIMRFTGIVDVHTFRVYQRRNGD